MTSKRIGAATKLLEIKSIAKMLSDMQRIKLFIVLPFLILQNCRDRIARNAVAVGVKGDGAGFSFFAARLIGQQCFGFSNDTIDKNGKAKKSKSGT